MSEKTFEELIAAQLSSVVPFKPFASYDPEGDCIEFLISDEGYYAERIDSLVTVYYGRESGEIIGSVIKGVSRFIKDVLKSAPGLKIEVEDGRIKLEYLFTAKLWSSTDGPDGTLQATYKKLREVAERHRTEAEVDDLFASCA